MTNSKSERLKIELEKLESIGGILGSAIVNQNGILVTSRLTRDIDDRKFGAMIATMFRAMETAAKTLGTYNRIFITVELNDCQIFVLSAGNNLVLASLVELNINLGFILIELEETIKKIKKIWLGEILF